MRTPRVGAALQGALVLLLAAPFAAHAESERTIQDYIDSVVNLYESLDYEQALEQMQFARRLSLGTEEEVTLFLYEGIILFEMGQQAGGAASFKSALLMRPDAELPVRVAPKVEKLFESVQQQARSELASSPARRNAESLPSKTARTPEIASTQTALEPNMLAAPFASSSAPRRDAMRRYALIPAIAGAGFVAAGGISWAISRGELNQLRNNDPRLATPEDVRRSTTNGRAWQTAGVSLLSVGAVGLATAVGMYVLGAPDQSMTLGVSTNGTSAFVYGRWP